jgi:hypothetical protein
MVSGRRNGNGDDCDRVVVDVVDEPVFLGDPP